MQQDPAGYVDGQDLYRYVDASPVAFTDQCGYGPGPNRLQPSPPMTVSSARATLEAEIQSWRAKGWDFAADLLRAWLDQSSPPSDTFQKYAQDIAKHERTFDAAKRHFQNVAEGLYDSKGLGKFSLTPVASKDNNDFTARFNDYAVTEGGALPGDLAAALGGAHFGYTKATVRIWCSKKTHILHWEVKATMTQTDLYNFPDSTGVRSAFKNYDAAHFLESEHGYKPFYHTETWDDVYSGEIHRDRIFPF